MHPHIEATDRETIDRRPVGGRRPNPARPAHTTTGAQPGHTTEERTMIYILAAILPPLGLLLNGQPFAAIFNLVLLVVSILLTVLTIFSFPFLLLVPSAHALIAVHMKREDRRHREIVDAIERHGPPPGWR
ncbi:hypothetical protein A33M_4329 [Rhodovulum sp. PH10]|nr:hypothetical protein A33M_4329 [Rhodovulum sp. PH10]